MERKTAVANTQLISNVGARRLTRRSILKRGAALAISIPVVSALIAACEADDDTAVDPVDEPEDDDGDADPVDEPEDDDADTDPVDEPEDDDADVDSEDDDEPVDELDDEEADDDEGPGDISRGGELNILQINDFVSMDPIHASGPTARACFDWLLAWRPASDGEFDIEPMLAETWETSDDSIIFNLREGIEFHDGSELNADVVVWNLARMVQDSASFAAPYLEAVDPDNPAEALDSLTVQLNLTQPSNTALTGLSDNVVHTGIVSMQAAEENGEEWLHSNAVGTGPYRFVNWQSGDRLEVERSENYWQEGEDGEGLPYTDRITYRVIIEASTQFTEMQAGTTDFIENIRGRDVPAAQGIEHARYVENPYTGLKRQYFYNGTQPPFEDNPTLRQAINHAIDRDAIANALGGELGVPLPYQFAPGQIGYDESVPYYEFDLDRARELIEESGVETPIEVRLTVHSREVDMRQAELIQAMLSEIDVDINIDVVERVAWGEKVRIEADFEMATRQTGVPADPTSSLLIEWSEGGHSSYHRAHVPGLMDLLLEADAEFDPGRRHELFVEAQDLMHESAWYGFMWFELGNFMVHERVQGVPDAYWGSLREYEWWIDE